MPVLKPYKLASLDFAAERTVVNVGPGASFGDKVLAIIAGPCSVENLDMLRDTALSVRASGASMLRGGAFKPRTSPYSFQGLGVDALRMLAEVRLQTGLPVVTEVLDTRHVELVAEHAEQIRAPAGRCHGLLRAEPFARFVRARHRLPDRERDERDR